MSFGSSPKPIQPTPEQLQLEAQQKLDSAQLDKQENERRKRLLSAAQGIRAFRGAAIFRGRPSNTAGKSSASATSASEPAPDYDSLIDGARGSYY